MTYRIRDIQKIHSNPLNSSISKAQYSIPKADRFKPDQPKNNKFYELPSTIDKKGTTFGGSERKTIFNVESIKNVTPSPDRYFPNTHHSMNKLDQPAISFAKGRQDCKNDNFLKVSQNPGPGSYNPNPQFIDSSMGQKYSIRIKTQASQKHLTKTTSIPGPGTYNINTSLMEKDKILSKDRKYGCPLIKPSHSRRMIGGQDTQYDIPFYKLEKTVKGAETFNKTGGFSIGKSIRFNHRVKTENPGPGTYNRFSEF